jgi:hypothetical protein
MRSVSPGEACTRAFKALVLLTGLWGCSSTPPATSSSSGWITCTALADCAAAAGAAACANGYCVDASGRKLQSGASGPCDPLAPHELPVTLGTVLGVGKASQGTVYLADEVPGKSIDRVFVSSGTTLFRKRVTGSGSSGGGADVDYTFSFDLGDGSPNRALLIQRRGGAVTAMGLGSGGKAFIGTPGATDETLTVLGDSVPSGFTLRNLPGDVTIEYVADVDDGKGGVIVVTRPTDDWDYTDFRVFFGPEGKMVERSVVNVTRSRGSDTDIHFTMGAATYDVVFTFVTEITDAGLSGHPGPGTLVTGGGSPVAVTQRYPGPTSLPGFSFTCL